MPDHILDIHLDFDPLELARHKDPTRTIAEASHKAAEDQAHEHGRKLRHPEPIEVTAKDGTHPTTGQDVLLVGTRWICD